MRGDSFDVLLVINKIVLCANNGDEVDIISWNLVVIPYYASHLLDVLILGFHQGEDVICLYSHVE